MKEAYTPIVDSYRNAEKLPEHIEKYAEHPYDEQELRDLGRFNIDHEGIFTSVSSDEFEEASSRVASRLGAAWAGAKDLTDAISSRGRAQEAQIREEILRVLDEAILDEEGRILTVQNGKDEEKIHRQRIVLGELLSQCVKFSPSGEPVKAEPFYQQLIERWRRFEQLGFAFEVGKLHEQANRQNKKYNPKEHRDYFREEANKLNIESEGLFGRLRGLPIDRYHIPLSGGGETNLQKLATAFERGRSNTMKKDEVKEVIENGQSSIDAEGLADKVLVDKTIRPILAALRSKYQSMNIAGNNLDGRLEKDRETLRQWLINDELRDKFFKFDRAVNVYEARTR